MSRFFFDLIWKGRRITDDTGLELAPGLAIRNAAIHAAVEHAIDVSPNHQGLHQVEVRNAAGEVVGEVSLQYDVPARGAVEPTLPG
jgi:hypothetical protein